MPAAKNSKSEASVTITNEGSRVVSDQDVAEVQDMPKGFKFIEKGVITVAAPKEELDKARAEGTVTDKALRSTPFKVGDEEKPKRRSRGKDLFVEEPVVEDEEEIVETRVETTEEPVELDEKDFLVASGVYSNFVKTMDDVDREIDHYQRRVIELDGYEENPELFHPDSLATPEDKIATLKTLRSVANQLKRKETAVVKEPEKPKRAIDMLSDEEKMQLSNGENMAEILDKLVDLKVGEKVAPVTSKIQENEYETKVAKLGLTRTEFDKEVKGIITQYPYLKNVLGNGGLSLDDKIDLLQKYRSNKYSGAEIEAAKAAGRDEARALELKRHANFTLKPTRAARTVQTATDSEERKLLNQLAEARLARKEGKRANVSNVIADLTRTRRTS